MPPANLGNETQEAPLGSEKERNNVAGLAAESTDLERLAFCLDQSNIILNARLQPRSNHVIP